MRWTRGLTAARASVTAAVLATALATAPSAVASPTTASVLAGALGVTAPAVDDFEVVVLDGTVKTTHTELEPVTVTDARGSGHGWTLTLQATVFREWDGTAYVPDGRTLPPGSLSLAGVSVTPVGTDSDPPMILAGPHRLDGSAVAIATAAVGAGMGTFEVRPTGELTVAVPASAYARAYRSELSVSVTSGP